MMAAHSILVGGSIAARRLNCPASFQESLKQPPSAKGSSVYADRGTALHELMSEFAECVKAEPHLRFDEARTAPERNVDGYATTQNDIDNAIMPTLAALQALTEQHGGGFKVVAIEAKVRFPGIPSAFGTVDLILQSKTHVLIVDYKFGQGVPVLAMYNDPDGDIVNEQLMYYATAARHTKPRLFGRREIILAIIQPAFEPQMTQVQVYPGELREFARALERAVDNALSSDPVRTRGEWCRFAECKATCPLWTGPLLDLSALQPTKQAMVASAGSQSRDEWGAYLARAKHLVDSAVMFKKTIDEMLLQHLKDGGRAPGYALKPRAMDRKWIDDIEKVAGTLYRLGLRHGEIWQRKLQTFKVVDAAAKRLNVTIPEELRPTPPSTEMTLTQEGDPDALPLPEQAEKFRTALAALKR